MDGMGIALGICTNTRVLTSSLNKKGYIKSRENREWASIKSVYRLQARGYAASSSSKARPYRLPGSQLNQ
jgi:hypothetical protein